MQIQLNGQPRGIEAGTTLAALLDAAGYAGRKVAVEPRSQHASHVLADGDRVEIIHAIGGG